jgi:hypothetical protein
MPFNTVLLINCNAGLVLDLTPSCSSLTVYKNDERLGYIVEPRVDEDAVGAWGLEAGGHTGYCWAVCLNRKEDSVRVTPLPPPALTQDEFNWNEMQKQRRSAAEEVDTHLAHTEQARAADRATRQLLETGGSNLSGYTPQPSPTEGAETSPLFLLAPFCTTNRTFVYLPRQARDKHRESATQKRRDFSQGRRLW